MTGKIRFLCLIRVDPVFLQADTLFYVVECGCAFVEVSFVVPDEDAGRLFGVVQGLCEFLIREALNFLV